MTELWTASAAHAHAIPGELAKRHLRGWGGWCVARFCASPPLCSDCVQMEAERECAALRMSDVGMTGRRRPPTPLFAFPAAQSAGSRRAPSRNRPQSVTAVFAAVLLLLQVVRAESEVHAVAPIPACEQLSNPSRSAAVAPAQRPRALRGPHTTPPWRPSRLMRTTSRCGRSKGCAGARQRRGIRGRARGTACRASARVQLIKGLRESRGNGTSMISLIMPPKDQVRAAVRCQCACKGRTAMLSCLRRAQRRTASAT